MRKILILLFTASILGCNSNKKRALVGETDYQIQQNLVFKDASKSPLKKKDLKNFKSLDFFPVDSSYIVVATLKLTPDAPVFEMKTTSDRKPLYKSYAIASFELNNKMHQLTIYKDLDMANENDELFLPFTDETCGNETYGGGRYMDIDITDISTNGQVLFNFNNTYNPYCAYNEKYSCPITPRINHLDTEVKAGIKAFKKH